METILNAIEIDIMGCLGGKYVNEYSMMSHKSKKSKCHCIGERVYFCSLSLAIVIVPSLWTCLVNTFLSKPLCIHLLG